MNLGIKVSARIAMLLTVLLVCVFLWDCGEKESSGPDSSGSSPAVQGEKSADQSAETGGASYGEYLTAADVEKVTGLTGLKAAEENLTLRFTDSTGAVVYEARFYGSSFYEEEVDGNRDYYTDVPGVRDKAAICIPDSPYRLTFLKGENSVMTQVLAKNADGQWLLNEEQLISLAKMIASRLSD